MSRRLLIIDDEPNLLRAVAACLRSEGFEVRTARSGRDALVSLAESLPDLIISDVRMPGMDGHELVQRIRSSPRTALIPVIFLTAKDQKEDRIKGFRTGVDAYVTKPFEPDELLAVISAIFNRVERTRTEFSRLLGTAEPTRPAHPSVDDLTETEMRVAEAVARGLSNKEIAAEFGVSVRTVENHVSHILAKKGLSNRVEIARLVLEGRADG
ncbi:MAG TPA: response regulator transcription factor [Blastocatellia bacterium]|nr:response regulator transcription factor [Blastocatellia bacterium]